MSKMEVVYLGELRNKATHTSGVEIITDAPLDNQGRGESFSPTDLLCTSLGTCMVTIMGIEARKWKVPFESAHVQIIKTMQAHPRKVSKISLQIKLPISMENHEYREKIIQAGLNCPVALSLHPDIEQDIEFIFE